MPHLKTGSRGKKSVELKRGPTKGLRASGLWVGNNGREDWNGAYRKRPALSIGGGGERNKPRAGCVKGWTAD